MPPLEKDRKEVKEEKETKILTISKLLTRLSILLAQIKAGRNSHKLRNENTQMVYLLYQHDKISKNLYSNL